MCWEQAAHYSRTQTRAHTPSPSLSFLAAVTAMFVVAIGVSSQSFHHHQSLSSALRGISNGARENAKLTQRHHRAASMLAELKAKHALLIADHAVKIDTIAAKLHHETNNHNELKIQHQTLKKQHDQLKSEHQQLHKLKSLEFEGKLKHWFDTIDVSGVRDELGSGTISEIALSELSSFEEGEAARASTTPTPELSPPHRSLHMLLAAPAPPAPPAAVRVGGTAAAAAVVGASEAAPSGAPW